MIKSIFFPVLTGDTSGSGLAAACDLAREYDAHVVAVICIGGVSPVAGAWSAYPMAIYTTLSDAAKAASSQARAQLAEQLSAADVSHEIHVSDTDWLATSEIPAVYARYCDITVLGRVAGAEARLERGAFADLLLQAGRPLLLVPAGARVETSACAVVAWKPTREAARAVHDALPLLSRSSSVQVVVVEPKVGDRQHGELPGADIATQLARHGLRVDVIQAPRLDDTTGCAILRHAREQGAGLVVAGGYGHHRMREWAFGGVTQALFDDAKIPVLFSH